MKRFFKIGAVGLLLPLVSLLMVMALIGCGSKKEDSGKDVLAVSYESQKWLLEQIAGDDYEIVVLIPSGRDAETFDPDMLTMAKLSKAKAYFTTSTLGFESEMASKIKSNMPEVDIVDLTRGLNLISGTHALASGTESSEHSHGDPHLLSSLSNARVIASNMTDALKRRNPAEASNYDARLRWLDQSLASADAEMEAQLRGSGANGKAFVVMHPSLSYFARDYDLTQLAIESDGKEVTPRQLKDRLDSAAAAGALVMIYEKGHSDAQARQVASTLGIEAVPIELNTSDFVGQLEMVADEIADAANKQSDSSSASDN